MHLTVSSECSVSDLFMVYRFIQMDGLRSWCHWTTKECGTWGLQCGQDSTWGSSSTSECGLQRKATPMSTTCLQMPCGVGRLLAFASTRNNNILRSTSWNLCHERVAAKQQRTIMRECKKPSFLLCHLCISICFLTCINRSIAKIIPPWWFRRLKRSLWIRLIEKISAIL